MGVAKAHCVVPPILTAGAAPLSSARLARHVVVADTFIYPGKAKNSIDTLRRRGSTEDAFAGAVDGTVTVTAALVTAIRLIIENSQVNSHKR